MAFLECTFSRLGYDFLPDGKDSDIGNLESVYLNDRGAFLVVDAGTNLSGCVGIRRFSNGIAELKRLYVAEEYRGMGLGRKLCLAAIREGLRLGYESLRLDTTHRSHAALALFRDLGFQNIPRYNSDEFAGIFMERRIAGSHMSGRNKRE
jgi:ribosomal protein S18 acetylase RimI-like enzyme